MTDTPLSAELKAFFESGISVQVGTRDARLVPDGIRAMGARVEPGGRELTVFLPEATSASNLANLRDNGHIAVCFSRPSDHRSIQVKGRVVALEPAGEADRERIERYRIGIAQDLGTIGLPPRITLRVAHWPCVAARLRIESIFLQTPGPGAGNALAPHEP